MKTVTIFKTPNETITASVDDMDVVLEYKHKREGKTSQLMFSVPSEAVAKLHAYLGECLK